MNSAIHKAGFKAFWDNEAKWFDVNVNEDKPIIEGIGWYSYNEPFEYIFSILNTPTPNAYAGIASATNKWMLLVHGETVSIHGSAEFLDYVSESMGDC